MRLFLALCAAFLLAACGKDDDHAGHDHGDGGGSSGMVLKFTAIPDQNTTELKRKFDPVAKYLSEQLGVKVEYVPSTSYQASVDMFKNGDVHIAWFGGLTGVQARHAVEGARAIAQGKEDPKFISYFIANKDSGLEPSSGFPVALAAKKFTFGSESSTSGRLMPEFFIMENSGEGSAMDFFEQTPNFSGSHDLTAELVNSGQFEAGVLNYKVFEKRQKAGQTENCVVIWKTPTYADYNITAHPDVEKFGDDFMDRIQKAFLDMKDPALLGAFQRSSFIEAKNEDFEGIAKVAEKLGKLRS